MEVLGLLGQGASLGNFLPRLPQSPYQQQQQPAVALSLEALMAQAMGGAGEAAPSGGGRSAAAAAAAPSTEHYFNNREFVWLRHGTPAGRHEPAAVGRQAGQEFVREWLSLMAEADPNHRAILRPSSLELSQFGTRL